MMRPDTEAAGPWIALARADLVVAHMILHRPDATAEMLGLACFHGQQSAEKALKGVLTAWDRSAPRSHDLTLIGGAVSAVVAVPEHVTLACEALADYGVGPRYPLPGRLVSRKVAARAALDANTVLQWCLTQLGADR